VKASGILDNEQERGPSDHVPVWVDICLGDAGNADEVEEEDPSLRERSK
jgi:hypothetical protein